MRQFPAQSYLRAAVPAIHIRVVKKRRIYRDGLPVKLTRGNRRAPGVKRKHSQPQRRREHGDLDPAQPAAARQEKKRAKRGHYCRADQQTAKRQNVVCRKDSRRKRDSPCCQSAHAHPSFAKSITEIYCFQFISSHGGCQYNHSYTQKITRNSGDFSCVHFPGHGDSFP